MPQDNNYSAKIQEKKNQSDFKRLFVDILQDRKLVFNIIQTFHALFLENIFSSSVNAIDIRSLNVLLPSGLTYLLQKD